MDILLLMTTSMKNAKKMKLQKNISSFTLERSLLFSKPLISTKILTNAFEQTNYYKFS